MDRQEIVTAANRLSGLLQALNCKCFLCFGTLLHFVRDHQLCLTEDIDIGVIAEDQWSVAKTLAGTLGVAGHLLQDPDGNIWQASYASGFGPILDVFFWRKASDGLYYHAYDTDPGHSDSLNSMEFKGIPGTCFDVAPETIAAYQSDMRYGRAMTDFGTWMHTVPEIPEDCIQLPLPFAYGQCLDWWYPEWATPRLQFGVSLCMNKVKAVLGKLLLK
jgi:hypothetical protein